MNILNRLFILILCACFSAQAIAATTLGRPNPVVTGFGKISCVNPGELITVLGRNFGSQKGVYLVTGTSSGIQLKVTGWQNEKITAYLPSSGLKANTRYPVGIKSTKSSVWLSNIDKTVLICQTKSSEPVSTKPKAPTTAGAKKPTTPEPITSSHPDPTNPIEPVNEDVFADERAEQDYTTQAILPSVSGLLMNRQLPATPPKLSVIATTDASDNAIAEPDELLVISSNMDEAKKLAQQLDGYGLTAKKRKVLKNLGLVITTYRVPVDIDLQQTAINIRQAYPNMWTDVNHRYTLQGSNRNTQAAKNLISWEKGSAQCGKDLRIGLIDTAINIEHPALKSQHITSHSVLTNGIAKANKSHGTAIATILVGSHASETLSGMLPAAQLYSASVFRQRDKRNIDTTAEWIVSGIDWLLSKNVQVINMSVGGPRNLLVDVAIQRTIQFGVPVIAAAGNGGSTATAVYPAAQPGVIAVTAVDIGLELYSEANQGNYIDFAAPGVDIWAGNEKGAGKFVSGTSFSVPFVTAAIANIVDSVGPKEAYVQLQNKAKDVGDKGKDEQFGWGILQASGACL